MAYLEVGKIFSVKDPPDILDPNLYDFAMFLSVHLGSVADFLKFGEKLVGDKILYVQTIGKDVNKPLVNKCLELIELWIKSVESPKWQNLVEAAEESGFGGLATALIAEFGSQEVEPPKESVKRVENRADDTYTEENVEIVEKRLKARTLSKLKGKYAEVSENIRLIFEDRKLDVKSLILRLCSVDDDNITVFSTDDAFKKVHNMTELFHHIGQRCSIYDYELLVAFVESTGCQDAVDLLDDFTKTLSSSILMDLDLLCDDGELRDPKDFMPGTHKLAIKYVGGRCTLETKGLVQSIVCEHFRLKKGSIIFKGVQEGCVAFIYQISPAVKSYLLHHMVATTSAFFTANKIKCLLIDDEELYTLQLSERGMGLMAKQEQVQEQPVAQEVNDEDEKSAIFEEISQRISADIVPRWKQFAIELGFEFEEVNVLNKSASQLDVQECSEKMLKRWWDTNSNPNVAELITALQGIDQNNYAGHLEKASKEDGFSFTKNFLIKKVAKMVAPEWYHLGIQLGVKDMNTIQNIDNPVQHKYNKMLQAWLAKQTCSKHEMYSQIFEALKQMKSNVAVDAFNRMQSKISSS